MWGLICSIEESALGAILKGPLREALWGSFLPPAHTGLYFWLFYTLAECQAPRFPGFILLKDYFPLRREGWRRISENAKTEDSKRRYPQPWKLWSDGFQVRQMEGVFLLWGLLLKSDSIQSMLWLVLPRRTYRQRWSQHRGDFAVLPIGEQRGTLLGLFPTFQGLFPCSGESNWSSEDFEGSACEGSKKGHLHELPFEFGAHSCVKPAQRSLKMRWFRDGSLGKVCKL